MIVRAARRIVVLGVVLAGCTFVGVGAARGETDPAFKVIVHAAQTGATINRESLSAIFLRQATRWADGSAVQPVDQSAQSPVREAFSRSVHRQPVAAILRFWLRQISDGRGMPPPVKVSDQEVVAFVASRRGAVGYVSARTPLSGSVGVLQVLE